MHFSSSTCKYCGAPITFGPHPQTPSKTAPFNPDGGLHFATCPQRKAKRVYESVDEIMCAVCEALPILIYKKSTKAGPRLAMLCMAGHSQQISSAAGNEKLINATTEQAELLGEFKRLEWAHRQTDYLVDRISLRRKVRALLRDYRDRFGVTDDLREFTGAVKGAKPWWYKP